jgi:hypothetical protein
MESAPKLAEFGVHTLCRNIGTEKGKTEEHVSDYQLTL